MKKCLFHDYAEHDTGDRAVFSPGVWDTELKAKVYVQRCKKCGHEGERFVWAPVMGRISVEEAERGGV